jgi:DNA-directed RNA polymerase I and III subunit RPAC1
MNTIIFKMSVVGKAQALGDPASLEGEEDSEGRYTHVHSDAFTWEPAGTQEERYADAPPRPVHGDVLLAKLAPGQKIELEAHAIKGVGKDHAKWSPVCTAAYRLLPSITLDAKKPFLDEEAEALVARCPMGVYDIEDIAGAWRARCCDAMRACSLLSACAVVLACSQVAEPVGVL